VGCLGSPRDDQPVSASAKLGTALFLALGALVSGHVTAAGATAQWVAPATVSDPGQLNDNPVLAFDAQGEVIMLWGRGQCSAPSGPPVSCTDSRIQAAIRPPGQPFGAVQTLTGDPGTVRGDLPQLDVGADAQGGAVAIWPSDESGSPKVRYALRAPGQPFGSVQTISDPGTFVTNPTVAVDPAGNMIALWISATSPTDGTARYAIGTTATGFGPSQPLAGDASADVFGVRPQVAFDGQGNIIAAWIRRESSVQRIRVSIGTLQGFGEPQTITDDSGAADSGLDLATDGQGNAALIFLRQDGVNPAGVAYALRAPGQGFLARQIIGGDVASSFSPHVALAPGGRAVATWDSLGAGQPVRYATRAPGDAFAAAKAITGDPGDTAGGSQVALDARGDALVVWTSFDAGTPKVRFAIAPPGQDLAFSGTLPAPDQGADLPVVAFDNQGNAVSAWQGYAPAHGTDIQAPVVAAGYDAAGPLLRGLSLPGSGDTSKPVPFSVSPVDVWSPIASTRFDFGDGNAATARQAPHTYRSAGAFQVSVTSTDALGNSSSAAGQVKILDRTKPTISRLSMTRRTFAVAPRRTALRAARARKAKRGSAFRYTLSERASVTIRIERRTFGRRVGRSCRKPSARLRHRKPCARYLGVRTLSRRARPGGRKTTAFSGRLGRTALKPGRYRATLRAKDTAGNRSAPKRITFRIVRP